MKKYLLAVLLLQLFSATAQTFFIPKVGLSNSSVSDANYSSSSSRSRGKSGIVIGVGISSGRSKSFAIHYEILYVQKGFTIDEDRNSFNLFLSEDISFTFNYLEVPILARLYLDQKSQKFFLGAGLSFAYGVGGKYTYTYTENNNGTKTTVSKKGAIDFNNTVSGYDGEEYSITKKNDLGIQLGAGIKLAKVFLIELRYGIGLTKLSNEDISSPKNRSLQFTVGFPMNLQKDQS